MVRLRTATGARTVETQVSPLATDAAAIDLARRREEIPPEAFRTGKVIA